MQDKILIIFVAISLIFIGVLLVDYTKMDLPKKEGTSTENKRSAEGPEQYRRFSQQAIPYTPLPKSIFEQGDFNEFTNDSQEPEALAPQGASTPPTAPQQSPQEQLSAPEIPSQSPPPPTEELPPPAVEEEPPPPFIEEPINNLNNILDKLNQFIADMNSDDDDFFDPQDE